MPTLRSNCTREDTSIICHPKHTPTDIRVVSACFAKVEIFFANTDLEKCVRPTHQEPRDDQGMVMFNCGAVRRLISPTHCVAFQGCGDRDDRDPIKNRLKSLEFEVRTVAKELPAE